MRTLLSLTWRSIALLDRASGRLARFATAIGQTGLVALGVHLAADRLDDHLLVALQALARALDQHLAPPLALVAGWAGWPPDALWVWTAAPWSAYAASTALLVEVIALLVLVSSFLLVPDDTRPTFRRWWAARSVQALLAPLTLAGVLVAGGWSLGMAVEDTVEGPMGRVLSGVVTGLVLLRFGLPALRRTIGSLQPSPWRSGAWGAPFLLPIALLAWRAGTPWAVAWDWVQSTVGGAA